MVQNLGELLAAPVIRTPTSAWAAGCARMVRRTGSGTHGPVARTAPRGNLVKRRAGGRGHPFHGILPPDSYSGLVAGLGRIVRRLCRYCRAWAFFGSRRKVSWNSDVASAIAPAFASATP